MTPCHGWLMGCFMTLGESHTIVFIFVHFVFLLSLGTTTIIMIGIIVLFTPKMVAVYWHWVAHIGNDTDSKKNSNHIMGLI